MIPPERLHEIAESRRISPSWGEVEAMAAELLAARESISLPGYQRIVDERDAARAEAKKYHDALVARHGGEPVALLSELDAARAELAAVMQLAVDKWLDDDAGNPADRAARAREVALRAIEAAEAECARVAKQRDELVRMAKTWVEQVPDESLFASGNFDDCRDYGMAQAEVWCGEAILKAIAAEQPKPAGGA